MYKHKNKRVKPSVTSCAVCRPITITDCVQVSDLRPRIRSEVKIYWVMSYNVRKFIDVMAMSLVFLPR